MGMGDSNIPKSVSFGIYCNVGLIITARSELRKVLFLALSVTLFVYEISLESLN